MLMKYFFTVLAFLSCLYRPAAAQTHPGILMTPQQVSAIRSGCTTYPLLQQSFNTLKATADAAIAAGIQVPVPKDAGGGFTHEQHKRNYQHMLACGTAWQVTGDKKYVSYVRNMLLDYARQYESWPLHPARKSHQHPGKIFWQNLNDCVWGVYTAMAYDLVYDDISAADRKQIEDHLLRPELKFLTEDNKETLDWIHNHGTWCLTAVGLTGYVLNDRHYAEIALKGTAKDGKTGYLAQLEQLFSPDGYYTEGPYYQRYAMLPFVIFAKAVNHYQPEQKIFEYRGHVLEKAIDAALQTAYTNGAFFPVNDAMKDKTIESEEIIYSVDIAYALNHNPSLLDVAQRQGRVIVSDAGLEVAAAIAAGKTKPFVYKSMVLRDGSKGDEGGLALLRAGSNKDQQCILFKAASQGMGHGHFDRLNLLYYDNGGEIFSDYGSARFVNLVSKSGGDYLPENKTFAKQTIAHNTIVVDEGSQYNANAKEGQLHHPEELVFKAEEGIQIAAALDNSSYKGVAIRRVTGLLTVDGCPKPLLLSVCKMTAAAAHQYDLPFWYQGTLTDASFPVKMKTDQLAVMGRKAGYQHLWLQADAPVAKENGYVTLFTNNRFYTTVFTADSATRVALVSTGANDPDNNLRTERAFIIRQPSAGNHTIISITETHGSFNPATEAVTDFAANISDIKIISDNASETAFRFKVKGKTYTATIHYKDQRSFFQLNKQS